jgi:hypothetical protein
VLFEETLSGQRNAKAFAIAEEQESTLAHSHADPLAIAGQGTIRLEIIEDHPDMDTVAPRDEAEPSDAARYAASIKVVFTMAYVKTRI